MDNSISELKDLFSKVSAKAKTIPTLIQKVNQVLTAINSEIPVWLEDKPLEAGDYEEDERQDGSFRRWRRATLLGYEQVGNQWLLAIRDVELEIDPSDWERESELVKQSGSPMALAGAGEEVQRRAIYLFPALVELLEAKAESFLNAIEQSENLTRSKSS
jgi:hypothetical protein